MIGGTSSMDPNLQLLPDDTGANSRPEARLI